MFGTTASAQDIRYTLARDLSINDQFIEAGTSINVLGVLPVDEAVAESGQLVTFRYNGSVHSTDLSAFIVQQARASLFFRSPTISDDGQNASICTSASVEGEPTSLSAFDQRPFLEVSNSEGTSVNFAINYRPRPRNRGERICITGLKHNTLYTLKFLEGFSAQTVDTDKTVTLDTNQSLVVRTPSKKPMIELELAKRILPTSKDSVIPVNTTNIREMDVSVYRIDTASLPSYGYVFDQLDRYDNRILERSWADVLVKTTVPIQYVPEERVLTNLSLSDILGTSETGLYVATFDATELDISSNYRALPTQWFMVSDIGVELYHGANTTQFYLNSFTDGQPISDADISIIAVNGRTLATEVTDASGLASVSSATLVGSEGFRPEFAIIDGGPAGLAIHQLDSMTAQPDVLQSLNAPNGTQDTYLTLDRELYRHNENVQVFAVLRDNSLDAKSGQTVVAQLVDDAGAIKAEQIHVTGDSGEVSTSFFLSSDLKYGRYSVLLRAVDESLLQRARFKIEDYVPMTIEPKIEVDKTVVAIGESANVTVSAEYLSGGAATGLNAEVISRVMPLRKHEAADLKDFYFGNTANNTLSANVQPGFLQEDGTFTVRTQLDGNLPDNQLLTLRLDGTVFDIGGRPNTTKKFVPISHYPSYLGVKPRFGRRAGINMPVTFDVTNIDRVGTEIPIVGSEYKVERLAYRYNYSYNNGRWVWNRYLASTELISTGSILDPELTLGTSLRWGHYKLTATNTDGFTTTVPFYVGWGGEGEPSSEPRKLNLSVDDQFQLYFTAPFAGQLRLLTATDDIIEAKTFDVAAGENQIDISAFAKVEPGLHLLATLTRPVETGTEHLPQIALGQKWLSLTADKRTPVLSLNAPGTVRSTEAIAIEGSIDQSAGVAEIFLIDEGIHLLSGYRNQDIQDFFLQDRALKIGFQSNYGQIFSQETGVELTRVGGDAGSAETLNNLRFFRTVAKTSGLLELEDGKFSYEFDATNMEGKLRAVVIVSTPHGFVMETHRVTVQDPISIDVSLPRFTSSSDSSLGQLRLRSNAYDGPLELLINVAGLETSIQTTVATGSSLDFGIPFDNLKAGDTPVLVSLAYGDIKSDREFIVPARGPSYPLTEIDVFELKKANILGRSVSRIQPLQSDAFDLNQNSAVRISTNISTYQGSNLPEILRALDRYPYGCVEQVSSGTRGLLAVANFGEPTDDLVAKINEGINKLLAKQKTNGAFGYWDRSSWVYEEYQPYAVETLMMALPFAYEQEKVSAAILRALEYLYGMEPQDDHTQLYAYKVLASAGYEVTSRARYAIQYGLGLLEPTGLEASSASPYELGTELDDIALAYAFAAQIDDVNLISDLQSNLQELVDLALEVEEAKGMTVGASHSAQHLLMLPEHLTTSTTQALVRLTRDELASHHYRSTIDNARLLNILTQMENNLAGQTIKIDGVEQTINSHGEIDLPLEKMRNGFTLFHSQEDTLYLNVELLGTRNTFAPIDNGYQVIKNWYDASGTLIEPSDQPIRAAQGELYTVVISVAKTHDTVNDYDLLLTDLLPAGFEIEDGSLPLPSGLEHDGRDITVFLTRNPRYRASMDDRLIAHFPDGIGNRLGLVSYTIRASYETDAIIPDAHIEAMYSPEFNGRSHMASVITR